jgi:hypothetical protein
MTIDTATRDKVRAIFAKIDDCTLAVLKHSSAPISSGRVLLTFIHHHRDFFSRWDPAFGDELVPKKTEHFLAECLTAKRLGKLTAVTGQ